MEGGEAEGEAASASKGNCRLSPTLFQVVHLITYRYNDEVVEYGHDQCSYFV